MRRQLRQAAGDAGDIFQSAFPNAAETRVEYRWRRLEAHLPVKTLMKLVAPPVAVQVAIGAHIHHDVKGQRAAAELARQLVAAGARSERGFDHFHLPRPAPTAHGFVEAPERFRGHRVQKRRRDVGHHLGRLCQVDAARGRLGDKIPGRQVGPRPFGHVFRETGQVGIGVEIFCQRGGHRLWSGRLVPIAFRRFGQRHRRFLGDLADFCVRRGFQPPHLAFQGPNAGDLSDAGRHPQK